MLVNTFKGLWQDLKNLWLLAQNVADIKAALLNPPDERNFFMADWNKIRANSESIRHFHKISCPTSYAPDLPCYCHGKNCSQALIDEGQELPTGEKVVPDGNIMMDVPKTVVEDACGQDKPVGGKFPLGFDGLGGLRPIDPEGVKEK